jgi:hypothetical protein
MAVPGSGAISLNDFHTEAGGSSGSQCSLNDSDIRGLIGKGSGATMSFNEWYGASAILWTFSLTSGSSSDKNGTSNGYSGNGSIGTFGSVSDTSVPFYTQSGGTGWGATYTRRLYHRNDTGASTNILRWQVNGEAPNSGFTTMTIGSSSFSRSSASYQHQSNAGITTWSWSTSNPFSGTQTVTFE